MTLSKTSFIRNRSIMITLRLFLSTRSTMTNQNALLGLCHYLFEKQHYSYCQCVHQIACAIVLEKGTAYYFKTRMPI